jgi:hypothetical protein
MADAPPTEPLRIKVPANLRKYLIYLAQTTTLGRDENDVASWALRQQLEAMRHTREYAYRFSQEDDPASG